MRFLLLLLSLLLQLNISGYANHNPQENHAKKTLTSENPFFDGRSYEHFRYYSPDEGMYISQDPIRLAGNNPTLYGYMKDTNSWVDVFELSPLLTDAPTYAGVYHIVGDNGDKYVGTSVNIAGRLTTEHTKAAQIINSGNYMITYRQVNLGTAKTPREINHILRAHEQIVFDSAKYVPLQNDVLNANNPAASHKLSGYLDEAKAHGAGFAKTPH